MTRELAHRLRRLISRVTVGGGLLAANLVAAPPEAPASSLLEERLADGIYLFRAPSTLDLWTSTNVVAIVGDDDVTVFDSNARPGTARQVIARIRSLTDKPVRTLVNSHWHLDHWTGNDEYAKAFPGITIIATRETRDYMKRMGAPFFSGSIGGGLDRARAALATAIETGKEADGSELTAEERLATERDIAETAAFTAEMAATPRVLPNLVFDETLTFWRGRREFRLFRATGDATGSAVLYLPAEKLLIAGDVLVRPESGDGPPPWTTNSYAITPWRDSLRKLAALDLETIVPGQGPALHGKAYLELTAELFSAILDQVHAALEGGLVKLDDVQATIQLDELGLRYSPGATVPSPAFKRLVTTLVRKAHQEAFDGVVR